MWPSFRAYLRDGLRWARECKRIMADNGSLFWFGDRRNIAYAQVILDRYFTFQNHIYLKKASASMTEQYDTLRSFYTLGFERLLFYSTPEDEYNITGVVTSIRDYIRAQILKSKGRIVLKEINEALGTATNGGGVASACLSLDKLEPAMLTAEMYAKLQQWCAPHLDRPYNDIRAEYDQLHKQYSDTRRFFNNYLKLRDLWEFTNGDISNINHPTPKPEKMIRAMILTCSRPGDTVLVPFAGSGTECAMSVKEGRQFIAYDIEERWVNDANARVALHQSKPELF